MKINKNGYFVGGIVIFSGVVFMVARVTTTPTNPQQNNVQNTIAQLNGSPAQAQTSITDQDTKTLENTLTTQINTTLSHIQTLNGNYPTDYLKSVSVTKQGFGGGYNITVELRPLSPYGPPAGSASFQMIDLPSVAYIYITVFKNTNLNIQSATVINDLGSYRDQYGYQKDSGVLTTSINKNTADKYNWSLDNNSLLPLITGWLRENYPQYNHI
jgi:hypothetical protein